ncbi:hypothetical protein T484DRAFT_1814279 [Baffinella frigidus]|nr:hypothetical protein T484DRAFT_1814279 [Cryptophyta sp. CCMP2293]
MSLWQSQGEGTSIPYQLKVLGAARFVHFCIIGVALSVAPYSFGGFVLALAPYSFGGFVLAVAPYSFGGFVLAVAPYSFGGFVLASIFARPSLSTGTLQ